MPLEKAVIINLANKYQPIPVMFNPEEYSIRKKQQYSVTTRAGSKTEVADFISKKEDALSMELFFDTTDSGLDVRLYTEKIVALMKPTEPAPEQKIEKESNTAKESKGEENKKPKKKVSKPVAPKLIPPRLLFIWGSLIFDCVLINVTKKFTMFSPGGFPLRATLSVEFTGHNHAERVFSKVPLGAIDTVKTFSVSRGVTLAQVAARAYGLPSLWRRIADFNGIDNVRKLLPSTKLKIPPMD